MSRTRNFAPSYIPHTTSGRGRLQWYDAVGVLREKLLPGLFGSPEALAAKARVELELIASPTGVTNATETLIVAELLSLYLDFAEQHYRHTDGKRRSLDAFESAALGAIQRGEHLVYSPIEPTRMFGAIRADASCLRCHSDKHEGDLLGAFTYWLKQPADQITDSR